MYRVTLYRYNVCSVRVCDYEQARMYARYVNKYAKHKKNTEICFLLPYHAFIIQQKQLGGGCRASGGKSARLFSIVIRKM